MDEREALGRLATTLPHAGDDAAVVGNTVITTDMLHEETDFPRGTTRYTAGWRSVGASLSDVAAMGADASAAVAVYADVEFSPDALDAFLEGAVDVCEAVDAAYVGGDLDRHSEFTVATTAIGETRRPVGRDGAEPGEAVCVTGTWGRSAAAVQFFESGETGRANDLFRFCPRVKAGRALARHATAMMDSSDGLARSLHQLSAASGVGFSIDRRKLPIDAAVESVASNERESWELAAHYGEDFELVCTIPESQLAAAMETSPTSLTRIGSVEASDLGVLVDGDPLPDRGYTHGHA